MLAGVSRRKRVYTKYSRPIPPRQGSRPCHRRAGAAVETIASTAREVAGEGLVDGNLAVRTMTLPDRFIDQAAPDAMYADAGLTATDIAATALQAIKAPARV